MVTLLIVTSVVLNIFLLFDWQVSIYRSIYEFLILSFLYLDLYVQGDDAVLS